MYGIPIFNLCFETGCRYIRYEWKRGLSSEPFPEESQRLFLHFFAEEMR